MDWDDDIDEEALRLAALQSLQKPKFINKHNLIPIPINTACEDPVVKLEPISPSREQKFIDEKRERLEKQEKESKNKTDGDNDDDDDDDSFDGLISMLQAEIDGTGRKQPSKVLFAEEKEEVEFLDVTTNKRSANKEVIVLNSPSVSPRPTYRSRSRSRRRSWSRSWSRSPRLRRYNSLSRSPSPRYRRRRSKSWSPSPLRSPRQRPRSPYRSPRRWSRSPRRRRSRSPRPRKRSLTPPRRRTRSRTPPRRSRSPAVNRARIIKRDSPVRRRSPSPPRRRPKPVRRRSEEKEKLKAEDPVLEARRRKFESLPNTNKKINLKAVKETIEPVPETDLDIRLDAISDESEDSDGQEGRFKSNTQSQTRGKLLSFRSIREGTALAPPSRLEPLGSGSHHRDRQRTARHREEKPERLRIRKKIPSPKPDETVERKEPAKKSNDVGRIFVKKDLFPSEPVSVAVAVAADPVLEPDKPDEDSDLRTLLSKKRKERSGVANLLPLKSRLVQSALQNLGEVPDKQPRRVLVVDNKQPVLTQPQLRTGPKRRVRKVQDLEAITLLEDTDLTTDPDELIRPAKRKLKVKRSVTIASQVTN